MKRFIRRAAVVAVVALMGVVSALGAGCGSARPRSFCDVDDPAVVLYRSSQPGWFRERRHWLDSLEDFAGRTPEGGATISTLAPADVEGYTRRGMALIEHYHTSYEMALYIQVAAGRTLFDITEIGIGLATTAVGGETSKAILGATLVAVKGVELSISENFLQNQTSIAIIQTMRANRLEAQARIVNRLKGNAYGSKIEAESDLIDYFAAGSLSRAVSVLVDEANNRAAAKQAGLDEAKGAESAELSRWRDAVYDWIKTTDGIDAENAERLIEHIADRAGIDASGETADADDPKKLGAAVGWVLSAERTPDELRILAAALRIPAPEFRRERPRPGL